MTTEERAVLRAAAERARDAWAALRAVEGGRGECAAADAYSAAVLECEHAANWSAVLSLLDAADAAERERDRLRALLAEADRVVVWEPMMPRGFQESVEAALAATGGETGR